MVGPLVVGPLVVGPLVVGPLVVGPLVTPQVVTPQSVSFVEQLGSGQEYFDGSSYTTECGHRVYTKSNMFRTWQVEIVRVQKDCGIVPLMLEPKYL